MDFTGKWSIEGTDETLKILATSREERFLFEYSGSARKEEKVNLFMSNERYALLTASKVFGRADVFILSKDTFLINEIKLVRMPMV